MMHLPDRPPCPSAEEALQRLQDGNRRFLEGNARFPTIQKEILAGAVYDIESGRVRFLPDSPAP
jgi:hypothetical protein